jgi:hypothetical protein
MRSYNKKIKNYLTFTVQAIVTGWITFYPVKVSAQEYLKTDKEFPILAWWSIPESETSVERYKELKESGINRSLTPFSNIKEVEKALDAAFKAGVKLQPTCPELKSETEKTVKRLMNHPALAGYNLMDEPSMRDFVELGKWVRTIQSIDNKHYCYINLLPGSTRESYTQYVDSFVNTVPVSFISFDCYPIVNTGSEYKLKDQWYENLEVIAAESKKSGKPFWAFALTTAHWNYPIPTVGEIKLQIYSNLAYGAQGLEYFTYWTPEQGRDADFHHGPIGLDWKRTEVFDHIKLINNEIQGLAGVFLDAHLVSVYHTGKARPNGTRYVDKLPEHIKVLETSDGGAIISVLEKENRQFLVIVNRDFQHPMKLTISTDNDVMKVLKDGKLVPADSYTPTTHVKPGDVAIFTWKVKAK